MRCLGWISLAAGLFLSGIAAGELSSVAHPGEEFEARETVVWTPLFQAAWDGLHEGFGRPVKIEPENGLMTKLDEFRWDVRKTMPEKGWNVWAGEATREFIDRANAEAAKLGGMEKGPFRIGPRAAEAGMDVPRVALGWMERDVFFERELYRAKSAALEFREADGGTTGVAFFGVRGKVSEEHGRTVRVWYRGEDSFSVAIAGKEGEAVLCDLPDAPETFDAAVRRLREWRNGEPRGEWGKRDDPRLHEGDDLRIPLLRCVVESDFLPRLQGARHFEGRELPWRMFHAAQHVDFKLDEKGARVRAVVETGMEPFGDPPDEPKPVPRTLHFDRPFLVFLWRDGAEWPYFGAWIGDAVAMERAE